MIKSELGIGSRGGVGAAWIDVNGEGSCGSKRADTRGDVPSLAAGIGRVQLDVGNGEAVGASAAIRGAISTAEDTLLYTDARATVGDDTDVETVAGSVEVDGKLGEE